MPRKKERIRRSVVVGHDLEGNPVVKWATGYTNKEVEAKKQQLKEEYITGVGVEQKDMLYRNYAQQWYNVYKKDKLAASSKRSYSNALNNHILPYIGDKQMKAISSMDLQEIVNRLEGRSKTLIGDICGVLHNTFRHACAHGVIDRDPSLAIERPNCTKNERRALTDDETAAVLQVGRTHPHGLLLLLLYYTGMRRGEALGLQWGDINFESNTLRVRRDIDFITNGPGKVKTEAALREIPIPKPLMDRLVPLRGFPLVHVIQSQSGSFLNQSSYKRWWAQLMNAVYVADPSVENTIVERRRRKVKKKDVKIDIVGSVLTPHYFRHNYASVLYNAGVDVLTAQKVLGHSDPKTTIAIYTHLNEERQAKDLGKICSVFESLSNGENVDSEQNREKTLTEH